MHVSDRNSALANLVGAFALAVADRTTARTQRVVGMGGAAPAALLSVVTRPGGSIETLRRVLGLSQPATVRLVDRLVVAGLVVRRPGADRRTVAVQPTPAGVRTARHALDARRQAVEEMLDPLSAADRVLLITALRTVLGRLPADRDQARYLCRGCDHDACAASGCPVDAGVP